MQLLKSLSRIQWAILLFLFTFTPTICAAPIASFTADRYSGTVPLFVVVDAGSSSPWAGSEPITRFEWSTSTGIVIKNQIRIGIQLSTLGVQTITLTVWNATGETNSITQAFNVCNKEFGDRCPIPPPAGTNFKVDRTEGLTVYLKASDLEAGIAYEYHVRRENDFSLDAYPFDTEEYSIKLSETGTYIISLHESNNEGILTQLQTETVTVSEGIQPTSPIPDFFVSDIDGFTVSLDSSASRPGNNANSIVQYEYNWQSETNSGGPIIKNTSEASITFDREGQYTITLKVIDELGNQSITPAVKSVVIQPIGSENTNLEFKNLKNFSNVGEMVVMELVETGYRNTRIDLWVAIQLPSNEILFRTDVPLSPWVSWNSKMQPHKTFIENTDTNHHIFSFEVPKGIGGNYTLYAVYVEAGKQPVTNEGVYDERYIRSNLVIRQIVLANN